MCWLSFFFIFSPVNMPRQILSFVNVSPSIHIFISQHMSQKSSTIKYLMKHLMFILELFYAGASTCLSDIENFQIPTVLWEVLINFNCYCHCLFTIFYCHILLFADYIQFVVLSFLQTLFVVIRIIQVIKKYFTSSKLLILTFFWFVIISWKLGFCIG